MSRKNIPLNDREKNTSKISFICSVITLLFLGFCFHQLDRVLITGPAEKAQAKEAAAEKAKKKSLNSVTTADIVAVGDNLYSSQLNQSGASDSGSWNYDKIYENVAPYIQQADLALVGQETVLTSNHDEISGDSLYATPQEVGDALVNAGFDVIETATNHVDDYGLDMIKSELDYWNATYPNVTVVGTNATQEDRDTVKTVTVNDITIALLDYTYGTNSGLATDENAYVINTFDKEQVASDIKKAKEISDCVIFVSHWGADQESTPNEYEKQWATFLMQQGVDVCIGGHPHVLQPYGTMSDDQGNEMLIFYSLGNFVSTQEAIPELLGGLAQFTLEKTVSNGKSSVKVIAKSVEPLVMHYNYDQNIYAPYLLKDYTDELAAGHSIHNISTDEFTVESLYTLYDQIMSQEITPSTGSGLLDVHFDSYLNMLDPNGNIVDDSYQGADNSSQSGSDAEGAGTDGDTTVPTDDSSDYDDSGDYDDSSGYDDSGDYDDSSGYDDSGDYDDSSGYDGSGDYDDSQDSNY